MSQGVTLDRRQCVFVTRMAKPCGKQAIGRQAGFVQAWGALGEALEQRYGGLVLAQVVVQVDDVLAETVGFVFFEQQAVLSSTQAVCRWVPAFAHLEQHLPAKTHEQAPLLVVLLRIQHLLPFGRGKGRYLPGVQELIKHRLRADAERAPVERFENIAWHEGLAGWIKTTIPRNKHSAHHRRDRGWYTRPRLAVFQLRFEYPRPKGDLNCRSRGGLVGEQWVCQFHRQAAFVDVLQKDGGQCLGFIGI
ncbi:hypothetical protein GIB19_12600 [Pseudomonas sp. ITEM 17296]|uniref:hypothetical protein n=1 Tax=Pseudomonas sp. ITEM 17296 TaxID=2790281 RepID=UPI00237FEBEE|nr:hypothetical protein [Pseudomonas sp. ITEM 17296]MDE4538058.1 hypothetical protein [Pseudomonas sp. ITEM 17296]